MMTVATPSGEQHLTTGHMNYSSESIAQGQDRMTRTARGAITLNHLTTDNDELSQ